MTENWSSGYITEVGYQWGYFSELNPLRAQLALPLNGIACPEVKTACELGFGRGVSINLHAAASQTDWHGNDFNPAHAITAREMAEQSGAAAHVSDQSFAEFRQRNDLPQFDYIGVHGVWSWISDANRQEIVDFINARLKVGGVLYISYNVQPGWAGFMPLRNLMMDYLERIAPRGKGLVARIDDTLSFAEKMIESKPLWAASYPSAVKRLTDAKGHNRHYLAHEYFNRDWHPMSFLEMSQWLEGAKLSFACSANLLEHLPHLTATEEQREFLNSIPDQMLRYQIMDFISNQQFRRDYWVKGVHQLNASERRDHFNELAVVLTRHADNTSLKVRGPIGEAELKKEVYQPVLDYLADNKVRTIGDIVRHLQSDALSASAILQAMTVLAGDGQIAPAITNPPTRVKRQCDRINGFIKNRSRHADDINFMASPILGGGFPAGRMQQLFLLALKNKAETDEQLAQFAWQCVSERGQRLVKEGKTLESPEENLAELKKRAENFLRQDRPLLNALGIQ